MEKVFKCEYCGLEYSSKELAKKCFLHCTKYHACSIDIAKNAINKGGIKA